MNYLGFTSLGSFFYTTFKYRIFHPTPQGFIVQEISSTGKGGFFSVNLKFLLTFKFINVIIDTVIKTYRRLKMLATLFIIIFITFIGVGLPDSVFGTAWPAIYEEFGLPISLAGYLTAVVSVGTIVSSLMSARLIKRFGTGLVTAVSTMLTVIALYGYSFSGNAAFFFLFAIPLGLGAGSIDTALNSFVALNYSASKMSFLHCSYGIGVAVSPFVMSLALGENSDWRRGYFIVATIQLAIAIIAFLALPLWKKAEKRSDDSIDCEIKNASFVDVMKLPAARMSCMCFFGICALELSAGAWSSTFFVETKGLPSDRAALITMLFYIGLTVGRFISGLVADRLGRRRILRISFVVIVSATVGFLLPFGNILAAVALFMLGLGIGPVYPNLVHLTPKHFGKEFAESVIGAQQAMTYIGIMIMPWLFGVIADNIGVFMLPYYLVAMLAVYAWAFFSMLNEVKKMKNNIKAE